MGLFDKKVSESVSTPEIAECDAKIANLNQQRQKTIYSIGEKYVELNTVETLDEQFTYTDHNPVVMEVTLME